MEGNVNLTWLQGKSIDLVKKSCKELSNMFNVNFYFIMS